MLVDVKITGTAITAQYGSLSTGDILRCDKAFADHLVNDCKCAKYLLNIDNVKPELKQEETIPEIIEKIIPDILPESIDAKPTKNRATK